MKKYWITGTFIVGLLSTGWAQTTGSSSIIEIEAKGTITFSPDSFVVLYRFDRSNISLENNVKSVEQPVDVAVQEVEYVDVDYATDVSVEPPPPPSPPPTVEEMAEMRKRREEESRRSRIMRDSILQLKQKRAQEFITKLKKLGVKIPADQQERELEESNSYGYYNEYREDDWLLVVGLDQYKKIDSLSNLYGKPLRSDLLDIRMKNHDELKRRAYQKAIEVGKDEAQILASAMKMKLGKVVEVKSESIGIEELLPIVMRKELTREFRKRENLQPELYQLMQEFQLEQPNERQQGYVTKVIEWTWTEKVHIRFQTVQ
jgi:Protein of unknown function (DUF541)